MDALVIAQLCEALSLKDREGPLLLLREGLRDDGEKRLALWLTGSMIGEVKESGGSRDCAGKYIRVRVVVNVDQPLCRILRVDVLGDSKESTMLLRYERLPEHCFWCGLIGHVVRVCLTKPKSSELEDFSVLFGPWLNASSLVKFGQHRSIGDYQKTGGIRGFTGGHTAAPPASRELMVAHQNDPSSRKKMVVSDTGLPTNLTKDILIHDLGRKSGHINKESGISDAICKILGFIFGKNVLCKESGKLNQESG
ncbi:hypothetical protein Ddye_015440 [Dipteronia dyeriana]|uniref:Zinc knuckle CX2CX4HX4C domain-containing protein n=1 Tax=Dipteronia dyeriana TaxID=168575 RepID=A0AAD9U4V6_9ROSI|nr:hypothetical protein Ddye_015440 [Dipteronia dyeriana]